MQTGLTIRTATMDDFAEIRELLHELDDHHVRILPEVFQPFDDPTRQRDRITHVWNENTVGTWFSRQRDSSRDASGWN